MENSREPLLFKKYPGLKGRVPWMELGKFPTPVEKMQKLGAHLGCSALYLKRDDLSGETYGGNKVRKLEFSLADAKQKNRNPIITAGALGSNHVLATTIYAKKAGMDTIGIFVPQPVQENLRTNILCNCYQGCRIEYVASENGALTRAASVYLSEWGKNPQRPYLLWAGGSSTLGILGYVEGALEIASQVEQGLLPEPEFIFAPVGSAGTLAGLILGLKLAGLKSMAVGVRVYDKTFANERLAAYFANRTLRLIRRIDPSIPNVKTRADEVFMLHDYFGKAYAQYTQKAVTAMKLARELEGMVLEGTYSGKAMAAFVDFMSAPERKDSPALFINTYNSIPLDPLLDACPGPEILPEPVREYFERPVAEVAD